MVKCEGRRECYYITMVSFLDMYGTIDHDVLVTTPLITTITTEFKVYRRRWLYLVCICLANMSNSIVSDRHFCSFDEIFCFLIVMDQFCVDR